jgi:uncharacterized OB-fold protein
MQPIATDLYIETADGPRLLGGKRKTDGKIVFPYPPGAEAAYYDKIALAPEGKLWSWTVQRFRPKSPPYTGADDDMSFVPFAIGYVELPGEIIVESRLEFGDVTPRIGTAMELDIVPFNHAADGSENATYIFRAVA